MKRKIAVYTAIFNNHDDLNPPINYEESDNIDYYCITDNENLNDDFYKVIYVEREYYDVTKNARYYKIYGVDPINDYDFSIWHDASLTVDHRMVTELAETAKDYSFSTFRHPDRYCVYDEAIACIDYKKDYPIRLLIQIIFYWIKGIRKNSGMLETSIIVKNNRLYFNNIFYRIWWKHIKIFSRRDQISCIYALKKSNININYILGSRDKNPYSIFNYRVKRRYKDRNLLRYVRSQHLTNLIKYIINKLKYIS